MTKVFVICMAFLGMVLPGVSLAGSLKNNGNGTVTDSKTHLMWQQGEGGALVWDSAIVYCENLSLAGHTDWRLPSREELKSIIVAGKVPAINMTLFPNALSACYWSSTQDSSRAPTWNTYLRAWYVHFGDGYVSHIDKTAKFYVRCVRGGQ